MNSLGEEVVTGMGVCLGEVVAVVGALGVGTDL
jgi:hypothetical protein